MRAFLRLFLVILMCSPAFVAVAEEFTPAPWPVPVDEPILELSLGRHDIQIFVVDGKYRIISNQLAKDLPLQPNVMKALSAYRSSFIQKDLAADLKVLDKVKKVTGVVASTGGHNNDLRIILEKSDAIYWMRAWAFPDAQDMNEEGDKVRLTILPAPKDSDGMTLPTVLWLEVL
ncbi:MAG: hypothetical protein DI628_04070 [Blastochloris viridis]|uniref:Uncharacterized protein n=1 Tax=Blastochloris viridis TaxID=1079 RepID=A0A6N4RCS7_BLAVI|nr:MAG: hypothetical protein DI628_04070 [Blastochloris viridis]